VCFEYICWKFAGRLLDRVNTPLRWQAVDTDILIGRYSIALVMPHNHPVATYVRRVRLGVCHGSDVSWVLIVRVYWKCRTWNCRTWNWRTKWQRMKWQDMSIQNMKMQIIELQDKNWNILYVNRLHYKAMCNFSKSPKIHKSEQHRKLYIV